MWVCGVVDNLLKPEVNVVHVVVPVVVIVAAAAACGLIVACLVYRGKIKLAQCDGGGQVYNQYLFIAAYLSACPSNQQSGECSC